MRARVLRVGISVFLFLVIIAMIRSGHAERALAAGQLPPGIGERCNHSTTYREEIPAFPGRENAYAIDLPAEPGNDVVVCTAFMWDSDGQIYHYGFDVGTECQSGFCVAGMDLWKHYYEGKFWIWWEDPPAGGPPVEVLVWFREVDPRENTPGPPATYTPAPTATLTGESTPAPTPPDPEHDPDPTPGAIDEFLAWLPIVHGSVPVALMGINR